MSKQIIPQLCECNDPNCHVRVELLMEEALKVQQSGLVLIVNGHSADPTDELVETKTGYRLYRES